MNSGIFISHRSTDKAIADMLKDFLVGVGISNDLIFCSSLPGNDIVQCISREVQEKLQNSTVNIAILSRNYYESAYCLNEAGIVWFQKKDTIIIALPEIEPSNMYGFLNSEYKIRRLDNMDDVSAVYDIVNTAINAPHNTTAIINSAIQKLISRYNEYIATRTAVKDLAVGQDMLNSASDNIIKYESLTEDERVVLFYMFSRHTRKATKLEVMNWLNENEVHGVNVDNAFDLLSASKIATIADRGVTGQTIAAIELDIDYFRNAVINANTQKDWEQTVKQHICLASKKYSELLEAGKLDDADILFASYLIDERVSKLGDRGNAGGQIADIENWERKHSITSIVSNNYHRCLGLLTDNALVYESAWTSYHNPKEYTIFPSLKEWLLGVPIVLQDLIAQAKTKYSDDFPF